MSKPLEKDTTEPQTATPPERPFVVDLLLESISPLHILFVIVAGGIGLKVGEVIAQSANADPLGAIALGTIGAAAGGVVGLGASWAFKILGGGIYS